MWYENGQKNTELNYKDGKLDGQQTEWNENGQKERRQRGRLIYRKLEGAFIWFSGDVTSDGWAGKILRGTREHFNRTNQAVIKVERLDFKRSTNAPNRKTENDDLKRKLLRQYINKEITRQEYTELMKSIQDTSKEMKKLREENLKPTAEPETKPNEKKSKK